LSNNFDVIEWYISLFGVWKLLHYGRPVRVAVRQQSLISALALRGSRSRAYLAGLLWPESSQGQAAGNLRSSIWKISHQLPHLLSDVHDPVALDRRVLSDLDDFWACVRSIDEGDASGYSGTSLDILQSSELLPGVYDDWVIFEQERIRQRTLGALETIAEHFLSEENTTSATRAAMAAASIEPIRESAQRLLIRSHLAAGNLSEALNTYRLFAARLHEELGAEPSAYAMQLIWPISGNAPNPSVAKAIAHAPILNNSAGARFINPAIGGEVLGS
jgi:DNA-binding SARP family transcriptional activator